MVLESFPDRPLTMPEAGEIELSDAFETVRPVAVFDLDGSDHVIVGALVLVTTEEAIGVGYDMTADGWTIVARRGGVMDPHRTPAKNLGDDLRQWGMETQPWAEEGRAGLLLEAMGAAATDES